MENPKKSSIDQKQDSVEEPTAIYGAGNNMISTDLEVLHPVLEKLIKESKQDSKEGKGISHEEMMRRVKIKYPFLK